MLPQVVKKLEHKEGAMKSNDLRTHAILKIRRRRQRHRDTGLCLDCTSKAISGRRFCDLHLFKARAKAKQEYDWRIANSVCVSCGVPKGEKHIGTKCAACATKAAAKERKRRRMRRASAYPLCAALCVQSEKVENMASRRPAQDGDTKPRPWDARRQRDPEAIPPLSLSA